MKAASWPLLRQTSGLAIDVQVGNLGIDPILRAVFTGDQSVFRRDEVLINRIAQMRQVKAAEGAMPPGTIALGAIQLLTCFRAITLRLSSPLLAAPARG